VEKIEIDACRFDVDILFQFKYSADKFKIRSIE